MGACLKFLELPLFPNEVISVFTPIWFQFKCQICFVSHSCIHKIWVRHRCLFMCAYIYVYYMLMLQMIFFKSFIILLQAVFSEQIFFIQEPFSLLLCVYLMTKLDLEIFLCIKRFFPNSKEKLNFLGKTYLTSYMYGA